MNNNDDLVNDILKELESNEIPSDTEIPRPEEPVQDMFAEEAYPEGGGYPEPELQPYPQDSPVERPAPVPVRAAVPHRHRKKKKKRSRVPGVLILTTLIFGVSIILSLIIIAVGKDMLGIDKDSTPKNVVVANGATTDDIAHMLKDEGIIRFPDAFIMFSKLRKSDTAYIPGEHMLRSDMAYETIIQKLTTAETANKEPVEITFPEGITLDEIAEKLEEKKVCKANDFLFNFNSGNMGTKFEEELKNVDNSLKFRRMEGYAFPDTYMFTEDMAIDEVCFKIYHNFDKKMTTERYAKMKERGLTLDELITFASIVQKEAASPETMNVIASIFWNRLKDPEEFAGKLQSDPTKNYAKFTIKPKLAVSNKAMLDAYDTYVGEGLPPGAICNPGIDAIDAVLDAIPTEYRYFAANIYTAETKFAKTYEEHLQNLDEIHAAEKEYEAEHANDNNDDQEE
ncbi:MAG: endolytic transglycosylase MltG [Ruminococcus sp.]|nr:endolytic transglycosylase MltG [Ruminococcus sp.]